MLAPGGIFVEIGNIVPGGTATIEPRTLLRRRRLIGSSMFPPALIPRLLEFLLGLRETVPVRSVISHKFELGTISEAFTRAE